MASGFARDLRERFFGVHVVIHSRKAIRTAMDENLSESHALPLSL